jgi:EAL domain-containing protein (putative c-di-GMP-specific phosphodiesterase class I)
MTRFPPNLLRRTSGPPRISTGGSDVYRDVTDTTQSVAIHAGAGLEDALRQQQLVVHYQGIFPLQPRGPEGSEALLRWDHPTRGLLVPADFLPEDMGSTVGSMLTNFVLEDAAARAAGWQRAGLRRGVSVNIAPNRLSDEVFPAYVAALLRRHRLDPRRLTIEVTEARFGSDLRSLARPLATLARMGVRLSLDDFGTGESSLVRLQHLHFDELKIDRAFVSNSDNNPTDRHIVRFAANLAHSLGMTVVAEGIETQACLELMTRIGLDAGQGFHLQAPGRH